MIHPGGLGDVFLAVPAIIRLRNRFPSHLLVLWAEAQAARLLVACGVVDAWAPVQGLVCADLFVGESQPTGKAKSWFEQCDLAVAWMKDLDGKVSRTLTANGAKKVLVESPFSSRLQATHQRDRFLEAIDEAPSHGDQDVLLRVTEPVYQLGRACLEEPGLSPEERLVVIHPGSGSAHKCVSPETMASVVSVVENRGAIPVLLEGPADREPVERLLRVCVNQPMVLQGLDLLAIAGILAQSHFYIGQDSGVTHLAALMGTPTVALFGPTDPDRWAPQGPHVTVIQGRICQCKSWGEVSRCREKPCLEVPRGHLTGVCLAYLNSTLSLTSL